MDTDDLPKRKLQVVYRAPTAELICFLDFSVSTTGMLAGIKVREWYTPYLKLITMLLELRTQNSEIVYLTLNLQIHAIHKLNKIEKLGEQLGQLYVGL